MLRVAFNSEEEHKEGRGRFHEYTVDGEAPGCVGGRTAAPTAVYRAELFAQAARQLLRSSVLTLINAMQFTM